MSLMHKILEGYLRAVGRYADANEVAAASADSSRAALREMDEIPLPAPLDPLPPALVTYGDERDTANGHAAPNTNNSSAGGGSSASTESANAPAASVSGAESGSTHTSASSAGGADAGTGTEEGAEREAKPEHAQEPTEPPQQQPSEQQSSLQDDPLQGIYSGRMRSRIESDAFRTCSGDAQDSAIVSAADRLLSPEVRSVLNRDVSPIDISPAARQARIDALAGEIPRWARGDLENDPAVLRTLAAARDSNSTSETASNSASDLASRLDASSMCLREPADTPAAASTAMIAKRAVPKPAQEAEQPSSQLPSQPSRAAAGRDLER